MNEQAHPLKAVPMDSANYHSKPLVSILVSIQQGESTNQQHTHMVKTETAVLVAAAVMAFPLAAYTASLHARMAVMDERTHAMVLRITELERVGGFRDGTVSRQLAIVEERTHAMAQRVTEIERAGGFREKLVDRQLSEADSPPESDDRATVQVNAPDGVSEIVFGDEAAIDNVVWSKAHLRDGGNFTLSRNESRALNIGMDGVVSMLTDPLQIPSTLSSTAQAPLRLSSPSAGVVLQDQHTKYVYEVDGTTQWSTTDVLVYVGDTVHWSWVNYHNLVQINDAGTILTGGIRSGDPTLSSAYSHTFEAPGRFVFKSQAGDDMRMAVEVREFAVRNGTLFVGGDLEVGPRGGVGDTESKVDNSTVRIAGKLEVSGMLTAGPGFEQEVRIFLGGSCPPGWTEATETKGKLLASRGGSETVGSTKSKSSISATQGSHTHQYQRYYSNLNHYATGSSQPSITVTAPSSFLLLACKRG